MSGRQQIKMNALPVLSSRTVGIEFQEFAGIRPPIAWPEGILQGFSSPIPPAGPVLHPSLPSMHVAIALVALGHGLVVSMVVGLSDLGFFFFNLQDSMTR